MPDTLATYYKEELINWDATIDFYRTESDTLESKLFQLIQQNTIPQRAEMAEQFLNQLTSLHSQLESVAKQMHRQNDNLQKDDTPINDEAVTEKMKKDQNLLRDKMQTLEKNFVELKYACYNFLSAHI